MVSAVVAGVDVDAAALDRLAVLVPVPVVPALPVAAGDSQEPLHVASVYTVVQSSRLLLLLPLSVLAVVLEIVVASCLFFELLLPWLLASVAFARGWDQLAVALVRPLY